MKNSEIGNKATNINISTVTNQKQQKP